MQTRPKTRKINTGDEFFEENLAIIDKYNKYS